MNAPARIKADEPDREASLRAAIGVHCPNQSEFAMACRVDIAAMRDHASSAMFRASPSAAALLSVVAQVATASLYAPAGDRQLMRTRFALHHTIEAARALEKAQADGR